MQGGRALADVGVEQRLLLTSPSAISRPVSRQRHHWLENTAAEAMPLLRNIPPTRTAWARPSAERLLVLQSASRIRADRSFGANA